MPSKEVLILIAALVLVLSSAAIAFLRIRRDKEQAAFEPLDDLEGHEFEFYCADLLRANGFDRVQVTRGSGDFGADILAEKDGVTYAVQCKRYAADIGVAAVQEALAGREYYHRMVGAVMSNHYYTRGAREAAEKMRILLWDREDMELMKGCDRSTS